MTKQEVLQDIDKLCGEIDKWTSRRVAVAGGKDPSLYTECTWRLETLIVDANQELSMLRDYIEENIKEE